MRDETRRNMPLFSMGTVTKLTELTPRQVRYYEQQGLIRPARTNGNQRLFSFNDVDRLLHVKTLMEKGVNIAGVKEMLQKEDQGETVSAEVVEAQPVKKPEISEAELYKLLKRQLADPSARSNQNHLLRGELSRFFH
ncbi:MerR family transcriptional regulator, glutamine synthetase repressor [Marininema mesophilum]|uniref:MerR family transcriptional regulator, glutamine synthetase repressor n=1 Tax=Marininema mesophilum TaxID=1048340 RepID=A0A1H2ZFB9_9BACL|nr:MerR family transcriptional regulator [Marininema mesophilum]SDX16100.1 MerR family transcriptional regulator, glutamine synthetase repressor [Marininema mesophilum]